MNKNISLVFNLSLLIIGLLYSPFSVSQQQTGSSQLDGLNSPVNYQASDSIVGIISEKIVRLYGQANVQYEDIELTADLIEINLETSEVTATYSLDSVGNPQGKPVFSSAGEESQCEYMKYNFKTKKGFIKEVRMQQGEGYIHMAESKIHPNEEIHFRHGKFTTCDKEEPHFHFNLTRAIVVPDKRIVAGPVYMEILRVPVPLALPFGFFPNSETKKAGIILPEFQNSSDYGFGLDNLGYYIPLGDYWETYFYGSIFTTGSWAGQNITKYYKKYKYRGGFDIRFEQFRGKFYDSFETKDKWILRWNHAQDSKAHPTIRFSTSINYVSDNTNQTSLDGIVPDYYKNTFNSSIKLTKSWKANRFNGTMGLQSNLQQNSQTKNYTMNLPTYNLSVSRFNFGVFRKSKIGKKWYEKVNVTYSLNARNAITAPDSIFNTNDLNLVGDYAKNGMEQKVVMQSNLRLFGGRATFTPSINYREYWNLQSENREWNEDAQKVDTSEINQFKTARDLSFSGGVGSNFYGYYKLKGKQQIRFRHVATPNISFTYRPKIDLYEEIQIDSTGKKQFYSPFSQSLYKEPGKGSIGILNFGLSNTFEMKKRAKKDSINETVKAFKLIDAFSINGGYDFLKDSLNLSNFKLAFRTSRFLNIFSFQTNALLSPYSWIDSSGYSTSQYAWKDGNGIGRIKTADALIKANFTNKKGRQKQKEASKIAENNPDDPSNIKDPNPTGLKIQSIPWSLNLSYNVNYKQASLINGLGSVVDSFKVVQTIRADGNIDINNNWKIDYLFNYDIQDLALSNFNIGLWRNLHCWETSLYFQHRGDLFNPNPGQDFKSNWTVLFKIGVKASMFKDIKYDQTFSNPF